jgi:hypothetical protein
MTKPWPVQLATSTKRKVVNFISDFEFSLRWSKDKDQSEHPTTRVLRYDY